MQMTKRIHTATAGDCSAHINDHLAANPERKHSFVERAFDEFTVDGKTLFSRARHFCLLFFYYNKALFEKYNVSFPKTYDDLKRAITVFKQNNIIPIAMGKQTEMAYAVYTVQHCS
jgi:raffinose/stachyose/melibiose transport system substrate-binding protein